MSVFAFVLIASLINAFFYATSSTSVQLVFNTTTNSSMFQFVTTTTCTFSSVTLEQIQDYMFVSMRVIVPMIIMFILNVILVKHIHDAKKKVLHGREKKRDHTFTIAVSFVNGAFCVLTFPFVVATVLNYTIRSQLATTSLVSYGIFLVYFEVSQLMSYFFSLGEFFLDITFNRLFRKEIFRVVLFFIGKGNQVEEETKGGSTVLNHT